MVLFIIGGNFMAHSSPFELTILGHFLNNIFSTRDKITYYIDVQKIISGYARKVLPNELLGDKIN